MASRRPARSSRHAAYTPKDQADFMRLARDRFKQAQTADEHQRERELEDLEFYAGKQWPQDILNSRAGQPGNAQSGLPPVPARPSFTINKVREPVRQVLNEEREAELGVEIAAADDFGDQTAGVTPEEIQLREGLVRRIQRESQAADARSWAFSRATIAGRGFYGVMTKYLEGKTFDQEIYVQRFYNQASVSLDPAHEQPDGSDAEWGFVGTDLPWDKYKADYGKVDDKPNAVASTSAGEFRALGDELPGWFTATGETRSVRIVEYWYTERVTETLTQLVNGQVITSTDPWPVGPDGQELPVATDEDGNDLTRTLVKKQIKWAKIDGVQILEETDWPGHYIPIVKVVGEELQPYDSERRSEGMVRQARDANKGFNFMISKWVEQIGLAPIPPWMGPAGFDEGFENEYALSTTRTLPALHFNTRGLDGQPIEPPQRTSISTDIAAIAGSVQVFDASIKSTIGVPDITNLDPKINSDRQLRRVLMQSKEATNHYIDNLGRSIRYEGQIINDLLYPIYSRPGRLARMMTPQGETMPVPLHTPFVPHPETQQPITSVPGPMGPTPVTAQHPQAKVWTLTPDATFNITVKVTKNYDTRREDQENTLAELVQADPQQMAVVGDLLFKYNDGPGHEELEQRYKAMLAPQVVAALAGQQQNPQVQQLQQQVQQLTMALQTKQAEIQAKGANDLREAQLKAQADLQKAQLESETRIKIALIQAVATETNTQAKIDAENARTFVEAEEHKLSGMLDLHVSKVAALTAAMQQQHQHAHDVALSGLEHKQTLEQAQHAAELAPVSPNGTGESSV